MHTHMRRQSDFVSKQQSLLGEKFNFGVYVCNKSWHKILAGLLQRLFNSICPSEVKYFHFCMRIYDSDELLLHGTCMRNWSIGPDVE